MFTNTPFASIAKTMTESAPKFNATSLQDAIKPVQDNLKVWGDLAQSQAQAVQASITEAVESFKSVKEPQAAFEAMKAASENTLAIATQNLKDITALSVSQFNSGVDSVEKSAPEAFANVGKSLKTAASSMESTLDSMLEKGATAMAAAAPAANAKKKRSA